MSFSTEVKTELASLKHNQCCNKAELSAMLHIGGSIEIKKEGMLLTFQSTNNAVIRKYTRLLKELYKIDVEIISKQTNKLQKHDLFIVKTNKKVPTIIEELSLVTNSSFFEEVDPELIEKECCKRAYLRGAFLAGGSMNSPETASYHLEIQTFSQTQADVIKEIANEFQLNAKTSKNKRGIIVYMKEAEKLADFLRVTEATNSLFEYEDSRIKRDFKNSINRVINCDIANEKKAMDAAVKQMEYIEIIERKLGNQIPKSMQEAIYLRKLYPESSLLELSYASEEHYDEAISKSALNHRFRAIKDLALSIKIQEENK